MEHRTEITPEHWRYDVLDGARAVTLRVICGAYGGRVPAILARHWADPDGGECDLIEGGRCALSTTIKGGRRFWQEHGNPAQPEQGEAFWKALEGELP